MHTYTLLYMHALMLRTCNGKVYGKLPMRQYGGLNHSKHVCVCVCECVCVYLSVSSNLTSRTITHSTRTTNGFSATYRQQNKIKKASVRIAHTSTLIFLFVVFSTHENVSAPLYWKREGSHNERSLSHLSEEFLTKLTES